MGWAADVVVFAADDVVVAVAAAAAAVAVVVVVAVAENPGKATETERLKN